MIIVIFGRAAQFLLLLLVMRASTTYLSPAEMGRLSLIAAATAFFAMFLVNPVGMFINRRLHAWNALGRAKYYLKWHWIYLSIVCVIAAASLAFLNEIHSFGFHFNTTWLLVLVCGALFFNTVNQTAIPSLNLLEFRSQFIILTLATIAVGLACSLQLVRNFEPTAEYWLLGLLIGQIIFAVIGVQWFFDKLEPEIYTPKPTHVHFGTLFHFAWPVAIAVGFNWLQTQGYRFFVADSIGLSELGLFTAGYGISAGMVAAFDSVLTTYFQPRFYKRVSYSNRNEQSLAWNRYAGALLPSLALLTFMLIGLTPELTRFMVGPAYQSASEFVIWGVLAEGARVISGVYSLAAHAKMKTRLLLWPNIISAVVCIGFIWILVPAYGAHGIGMARVFAGISMLVAMHIMMIVVLDMQLPYWMLLKGVVMGVALLCIVMLGRWVLGGANSAMGAGLLIMFTGLVFLPMFYWLLFPFLPRHDMTL